MGPALAAFLSLSATPAPADGPLVPWFVPRGAQLGVFINAPAVAPNLRLSWEGAIYEAPANLLVWHFSLGSAVGLALQAPMREHYQHAAVLGLGYRSNRERFCWGFHAASGPLWYRAAYAPGTAYRFESRVLGYVEGRLQAGVRLAPHFILSAYFGYASPFSFNTRFPGNTFVGGISTGLAVDWR